MYLTGQPLTTFCVQALQNVLHLAAGQDCGLCVSRSGWAVGIDACHSPPYTECFYSPGISSSDPCHSVWKQESGTLIVISTHFSHLLPLILDFKICFSWSVYQSSLFLLVNSQIWISVVCQGQSDDLSVIDYTKRCCLKVQESLGFFTLNIWLGFKDPICVWNDILKLSTLLFLKLHPILFL